MTCATNLLVQEIDISSALVGNISFKCSLDFLLSPLNLTVPVVALFVFFAFVLVGKVGLPG